MEDKQTIILTYSRYVNGQDQAANIVYRGTHWTIVESGERYLLHIYQDEKLIASHKSWDNISFTDYRVKEYIS